MKYSYSTGGFYSPALHSTWPEDAVDISASTHADLVAGLASGYRIVAGVGGEPLLVAPATVVPTVDAICAQVDTAADAARAKVAGDPLRAVEYDRSRLEAEGYKAAGYQGTVPRTVAAWAINGRTSRQATDSILAEAAAYTEALYRIRESRLQAKELIRAAMANGRIELAQDIAAETIASIQANVAGVGNNASA